jgi:hypothetical protein
MAWDQSFLQYTASNIPTNARQALSQPEWKAAMEREMSSIYDNRTWKLVRNKGQRTVGSRWVFSRKQNGLYKARLVAKGYTQRQGHDYHETFAPVAKIQTFRLLLSLALQMGWEIHQMDVITAFLNGTLEEEVYMELPEGYEKQGWIVRLLRSLYGLKQSPRRWYSELNSFLIQMGFIRSLADEALYMRKDLWILVYVDDLFITGLPLQIAEIKSQLSGRFKMKDLGHLSLFLGMEVIQKRDSLFLSQSQYLLRILEEFHMDDCDPVTTPFPPGIQLSSLPLDEQDGRPIGIQDQEGYRRLIGSLLYAATHTRPDFAFAIGLLSRFLHAPGSQHWQAAKHLLRYIKGTITYGLLFKRTFATEQGPSVQDLLVHADADYAAQAETRKSTTGYVTMLAGAAITWNSTLQRTVAQSTMEAEYVALAEAVKEALWLSKLARELTRIQRHSLPGIPQGPPTICSDNDAALILAKNPERHQKAKHIDIRYHFIQDEFESGRIQLDRVPTDENRADILTKALTKQMHLRAVQMLGLARP